jgi:choline transport protein
VLTHPAGLPFSGWISAVHPTLHVPVNSLVLTSVIAILLALLNIGSAAAFDAIIALNTVAIMLTYALSIACVLHRRLSGPLPPARFSLGGWGVPLNVAAVTYAAWAFFWAMWPATYPVTLDTLNWAPVIFGAVSLLSVGMYVLQGRTVYEGPAALVQGGGKGDE